MQNNIKTLFKLLQKLTLSILSIFILGIGYITTDGLINDKIQQKTTNTYGIIYGNKVELNGKPSKRLKSRLDLGLKLYNEKIINKIIVSGGTGKEGFDEAKVMKKYLISKNITKDDIIEDNFGYTTKQTSENSFKIISILEKNNEYNIIGISQFYHITRLKISLKQSGFNNIYGYSSPYYELRDFYSIFREFFANLKYIIYFN